MKKLIFTLIIVITTLQLDAQNVQSTIEVRGETAYEKVPEKYIIDVIVSEALVYDNYNSDAPNFDEIKKNYFNSLSAAGINTSALKEDKLAYLSGSYRKKGMTYRFETSQQQVFLNFLEVRSKGTQIQAKKIRFKEPTEAQIKELIERAMKVCTTKATLIAKTINRELGAVLEIRDANYHVSNKEITYYNNYNDNNIYYINIKYALK